MRYAILLPALLLIAAILLPGCQSAEDLVPEPVVHTPLEFDPTEDYEVGPWWSNGEQMLRLNEEGSYALYGDQNRYHPPQQRGRWSRQSYAMIRLERYDRLAHRWIRVSVSRIGGEVALSVPGMEPMFAIDGPPEMPEDGLLGTWTDGTGTLRLSDDRRYSSSPAPSDAARPAVMIAGHDGRWRLEGDLLTLTPDPPNMGPYGFWIIREEGEVQMLQGRTVDFRRAADDGESPPIS